MLGQGAFVLTAAVVSPSRTQRAVQGVWFDSLKGALLQERSRHSVLSVAVSPLQRGRTGSWSDVQRCARSLCSDKVVQLRL